uniref:Reverse transcriptase domain-containing protein n=1 Tax=Tanacetum cinerariifolium TaxID=118510 RepID=A0A699L7S7_TANCI|nr:hypothetical protein [Tanacetum cinerariifolium]
MEDLKQQYLDELKLLSNLEYRDEVKIAELTENFNGMSIEIRKKEKLLQQEQWAYLSTHPSKRLTSFCYDDDADVDYTSAITLDEPVLFTEETDNSLNQIEDFSEPNEAFSLIDDDSFSIYNIDYVETSPPDSELVSSEVMEIVILEEETNTFDNSLPEFETFCFDVEEISSGSTTTHSDSSLYASFMFHLSINPFPPAERSDFYEFTDELIPFISPPEYDFAPHYLLSLRNEDAIFDPGICNSTFSRPDISHRCGTVKKFNTHRSHLIKCPMLIHEQSNPSLDVLLFHFYPP